MLATRLVDNEALHPEPQPTYLKEVFENLPVGVLIANDAATYVDVNRVACEVFGRSRHELVGHQLSEFIEPDRRSEVAIQWKAFLRDGTQSGAFGIRMPDGSSRTISFQARAHFAQGLHCSFVTAEPAAAQEPAPEALTICAWTHRIRFGDSWVSIEDYLSRVHGLTVTHGISPDAFADWENTHKK